MNAMTAPDVWAGQDRALTVEDMENMPDDEFRYELDDGVLIVSPAPSSLHQPYRAPAMPATAGLISRLRTAGIPAVVSGAGPAVLALTVAGAGPGPEAVAPVADGTGTAWQVRVLGVDRAGATVQA